MSKNKKRKDKLSWLEAYNRIRKVWGFAPISKVLDKDKKKRNRAKIKRDFKKDLENY